MDDDYKNKRDEEREREIDEFFSKFDRAGEVENQFDKITSNLDREPRMDSFADSLNHFNQDGSPVPGQGTHSDFDQDGFPDFNQGSSSDFEPDASSQKNDNLHPAVSRLSRLNSRKESKKRKPHTGFSDSLPSDSKSAEESIPQEKFSLKEFFLTLWATICAYFSALMIKCKIVDPPEAAQTSGTGETGVAMAGKRKRKKNYKVNKKQLFKFIVSMGVALCLILGVCVGIIIATTPSIDPDTIYSLLSENSTMYDDKGTIVDTIYQGNSGDGLRTNLSYADMPQDLVNAFISIEDKTFKKHHGFNFVRIFGAIFEGITKGEPISGTSTITQQLARNLYLKDSKSVRSMVRKIREAWYTVQLESHLSKEQIIEAYLNTIYLGSNASGVQAASQAYFSKDVGELTLPECALLASLPKNPKAYAPVKGDANENLVEVDLDSLDIISRTDEWTTWYNDNAEDRMKLVLSFMLEQKKIDQAQYDAAIAYNIRDSINPAENMASSQISSYFADYTIRQVVRDLVEEKVVKDEEAARNLLYNGGLCIYSTMNFDMQKAAEDVFADSSNFPSVSDLNKDKNGNVRDKSNRIMLYNKETYFDTNGNFVLSADEFQRNSDGSITLLKGKRLNFYKVSFNGKTDYNIEFKSMYEMDQGVFYSRTSGVVAVPAEYKTRDEKGNLTIDAKFFQDKPEFFTDNGTTLSIPPIHYTLQARVRQPQSAVVIMDQANGAIKAMVGGRDTEGRLLLNRATTTRQPGSSIKPMGVYAPALQSGADGETNWTAGSVIDDAPLTIQGKIWPKNWYNGYRGLQTLRQSVEQSINVNAVKVFRDIGVDRSVNMLKSFGITSIVEEGSSNDMNAASLALGGMTKGISPLEMCAGYAVFASDGIYNEPVSYTKITNRKGDVLLERTPETHKVLDAGVAAIMRDILRSTVTNGLAKAANIGSHPTAGKTGTTTNQYDAWFVGFSPLYTASVWIGNDVNIELSQGSAAATRVWNKIMKQVHKGLPAASFKPMPSNVISVAIDTKSGKLPNELSSLDPRSTVRNEFFIKGTEPTKSDDVHVSVTVCSESGYLATPWCPSPISKVAIKRPDGSTQNVGDAAYNAPTTYCPLHNLDTATYPLKEGLTADPNFTWTEPTTPENPGTDGTEGNENGETTTPPTNPTPPTSPTTPPTKPNNNVPEWLQ